MERVNGTSRAFLAGLWLFGLGVGVVLARRPDLLPLPTPVLAAPLIAAALFELAIGPAVRSGKAEPLTMPVRFAGVGGAAVLALVASAVLTT